MAKQVSINRQLVTYEDAGSGDPVIFLHGWRSSKEAWTGTINRLSQQGVARRFIALDLPGFGGSPAPKEPWNVGRYAELLAGFLTELRLVPAVLVGHSFGGRVAIKLAATQPTVIKKIVLVDSAGIPMDRDRKRFFAAVAKIVRPLFRPAFMQPLRRRLYRAIGAEDYVSTPELTQTFVNTVNEDLTPLLPNVLQETLIVWGSEDVDTPPSYAELMRRQIPKATLRVIDGAGHFPFLDKPDEFVRVIANFI